MSKLTLKQLKSQVQHAEYYNTMAPFPVFDTEYIQNLKEKMDQINESIEDYDSFPVEACIQCKNLHILEDEAGNTICSRCNTLNELKTYKNIHEYLKEKNIWNNEQ